MKNNASCLSPADDICQMPKWYQPWKRKALEYNSFICQPGGWGQPCRFEAMRILKEQKQPSNQLQQGCLVTGVDILIMSGPNKAIAKN
jgi:hypothetical protein